MTVDPDGSDARRVAGPFQQVTRVDWSTNGSRLVVGHVDQGFPAISVAAADGSGAVRLDTGMAAEWPSWRPGSEQIAFRGQPARQDAAVEMFLVNPDGSGLRPLEMSSSGATFTDDAPTWSTDGSQLSFLRDVDPGSVDWRSKIADVAPDGRVIALHDLDLVPGSIMEILPVWSPDSTRIAFLVERDGSRQIAVGPSNMRGTATLVGPSKAAGTGGFGYAWSPDGRSLLITFLEVDGPQTFWSLDMATGTFEPIEGPTVEIPAWQRRAP
jgi:Tol biopolymer transport system component